MTLDSRLRRQLFKGLELKANLYLNKRSYGVMVSTLDFESSDPSSNLGGT